MRGSCDRLSGCIFETFKSLDVHAEHFELGQKRAQRARWAIFGFSVLGALLAALASQWPTPAAGPNAAGMMADPRTWLALAGALSLATATFFTQRLLGQSRTTAWVRARYL
jgi:hypothetical protein